MAASADPSKYEVLTTIGMHTSLAHCRLLLKFNTGKGSFGVIRKVRRKSDGLVSLVHKQCERKWGS